MNVSYEFGDDNFLGGPDSIIQVGSDSLTSCSIIYKFVTTNTFNCLNTIAYMVVKCIPIVDALVF